ncbi:hypothetical protein BT96DRAFT_969337 [Gymnopus androsaceus JB14]|uniref:Uncharacterized protein n=1 Tax=Gymnopus androsaceus JB14 TaxID=1447944 RepID=A0A6A4IDE8_9AGAR|nr:hypothetical protein BT96DRAFT_969337 [Gymnopus androsaceus JB14]
MTLFLEKEEHTGLMRNDVLISISKPLLAIYTRFLPSAIFARSSSNIILGFGAATFACGLCMSLYSVYQDLYYVWLERQISRSLDQIDKLEAKSVEATRRYKLLEEVVQRGDRIIEDLERWDEERNELENLLVFRQMPVACAVTDNGDPRFEEYDTLVQKKETRKR